MKATEHKETGEKMHIYEVSFLIAPTVSETALPEEVSSIRGVIEAAGATIIAEEFPKLRPLAYQMEKMVETKRRKVNEAYFGWFKCEMPVANIANIQKELEKRVNVVRLLVIKTVRENTMYSARINDAERKTDAPEGETPSGEVKAEDKDTSQKAINKSIDALVIS